MSPTFPRLIPQHEKSHHSTLRPLIIPATHFSIDHLVVFVQDLERAASRWSDMGLIVMPGGRHRIGTFNNIIVLKDGSYIELVSYEGRDAMRSLRELRDKDRRLSKQREGTLEYRWVVEESEEMGHSQSEEWMADLCLREVSEEARDPSAETVDQLDLVFTDGERRRSIDNELLQWKLTFSRSLPLPFIIRDVTDRELRVPLYSGGESLINHENGADGIGSVTFLVRNLLDATHRMARYIADDPLILTNQPQLLGSLKNDSEVQRHGVSFRLANGDSSNVTWIRLVQFREDDELMSMHRQRFGESTFEYRPFEVELHGERERHMNFLLKNDV